MLEGDWTFPIQEIIDPPDLLKDHTVIADIYFTDGTALLNFRVEDGVVKNVPLEWTLAKPGIKRIRILEKFSLV
jgi:hypothetical protein